MQQSDWQVASFGDCADFQEGYVNPAQSVATYFDGPISWLRAVDLNDGFVTATSRTLSEEGFRSAGKSATMFPAGSLAISKSGTIGRIGILQHEMCGNRAVINVKPRSDRLDLRFAFYAMLLGRPEIERFAEGSVQKNLYVSALSKFKFLLPPLPEQRTIASVLGALDDKIELNRRMNETLEAMARAIFKDWFVDFGPTRAKMEGRAPYLAPDIWSLFPDRLDDEGKPEGWRYWPLQQIIDFKSGQNWLSQYRVESSQIPTFGANGRIGFSSNFIDEGRVIFVGKIGSCGSINEYNGKFWATNNTYYVKQPSTKYIEHARCLLRSIDWVPFIGGSSNPYMPLKNFDHLQCLMAADAIHEAFETIVGALRSFIEHCEQENASLAATRDFLLPKLMSGEVRVKDAEKLVGEAI